MNPQPSLSLLPGQLFVLFLVQLDHAGPACVAVPPGAFLEGLRTAATLLGFAGLHRAEPALEELLPWAGNV